MPLPDLSLLDATSLPELERRAATLHALLELQDIDSGAGARRWAWNDGGGQSCVWYFTADGQALLLTFDRVGAHGFFSDGGHAEVAALYAGVPEALVDLVRDRPENRESQNSLPDPSGQTLHLAIGIFFNDGSGWRTSPGVLAQCRRRDLDLADLCAFDDCLDDYLLGHPFTPGTVSARRRQQGWGDAAEDPDAPAAEHALIQAAFAAARRLPAAVVPAGDPRAALRRTLRDRRLALAPAERMRAAEAVAGRVLALPFLPASGYVAGYWAMDGEVALHVLQLRLPPPLVYCLPVLHADGRLRFAPWRPGDALVTNRYGIPEPDLAPGSCLEAADLALAVLPLVGFDRQGNRLGMGAGWYDRSFASRRAAAPPPWLVGAAHAVQEVDRLPAADWDVPLDAICTGQDTLLTTPP